MSAGERRQRILELLCLRRQDTYGNLASEFGVSREKPSGTTLCCSCVLIRLKPSVAAMVGASASRPIFCLIAKPSAKSK